MLTGQAKLNLEFDNGFEARHVANELNKRTKLRIRFVALEAPEWLVRVETEEYGTMLEDIATYWTNEAKHVLRQYLSSVSRQVALDHKRGIE